MQMDKKREEIIRGKRKEVFVKLEQLRKKGAIINDKAELASYREEKYKNYE